MKKSELTSKNLLKALSITLSASMALLNPIAAIAEEVNEVPAEDTTAEETVVNDNAETERFTEEAADLAEETNDAIEEASEAVSDLLNEETAPTVEDGGAVAEEAVEKTVEAFETVKEDTSLADAAEKIEKTETYLSEAETANTEADTEMLEAVEDVKAASDIADLTVSSVETAQETADELYDQIVNTDSIQEAAQAYEDLSKLADDTASDVAVKKEAFEEFSKKYDEAVAKLKAAEEKLSSSLGKATAEVTSAKAELDNAKKNVEALSDAAKEAGVVLKTEQEAASKIDAAVEKNASAAKADWTNQRVVQSAVIINYYIPQLIDPNATDITCSTVDKGFDSQNSSHVTVTYKVDGVKYTRYFNYDRTDRKYYDNDQWKNLGSSKDIVIYEKTEEEIKADSYLSAYYKKANIQKGTAEFKRRVNSGEFDVFAYEENGVTKFLVRDEVNAGLQSGTVSETDGILSIGGIELHKVVQKTAVNSENTLNVKEDEELTRFLAEADEMTEKYENLVKQADETAGIIEDAKEEAELLSDAIDELSETKKNRTVTAAEALGVEDLSEYFGLELSEEDSATLNEMSLTDAISFLDSLLAEAKEKIENAELKLNDLNETLKDAEKELEKTTNRLTPDMEAEKVPATTIASVKVSEPSATVFTGNILPSASIFEGTGEEAAPAPAVADSDNAIENAEPSDFAEAAPEFTSSVLGARRTPGITPSFTLNVPEGLTEDEAFELFGTSVSFKASPVSVQAFELNRTEYPASRSILAPFTSNPFGTACDAIAKSFPWWLLVLAVLTSETLRRLYDRNRK